MIGIKFSKLKAVIFWEKLKNDFAMIRDISFEPKVDFSAKN